MPARPVVRALALGALGTAVFLGCTLDWGVRPDPTDGAPPNAIDGASDSDAPSTGDGATEDGTGPDGTVTDGGACDSLGKNLELRKKEARACQLAANQCAEKRMDVCCEVFVAKGDSGAAAAFVRAVADFKEAGCNPGCTAGCPVLPVTGGCLQTRTGDFSCSP